MPATRRAQPGTRFTGPPRRPACASTSSLRRRRRARLGARPPRRSALDERLSLLAAEPGHWPTVARLRCFRGIETLSAPVLHLEIGDFGRFERPGQLAAWRGLVPSLHQSGESETRGPITKTGSGFARRILVEAA